MRTSADFWIYRLKDVESRGFGMHPLSLRPYVLQSVTQKSVEDYKINNIKKENRKEE